MNKGWYDIKGGTIVEINVDYDLYNVEFFLKDGSIYQLKYYIESNEEVSLDIINDFEDILNQKIISLDYEFNTSEDSFGLTLTEEFTIMTEIADVTFSFHVNYEGYDFHNVEFMEE